jgi:lipopolysaccharide biosynthesis glycosyltransferase
MLPVKVLEFSIRKRASMSVEVFPLHRSKIPVPLPKDPKNQPRTPFSFQRFLIPALTGYHGRAIYLDSDMQVFKDIRALWTMPFDGADLLTVHAPQASRRRPQFSVMVLNCKTLAWDIKAIVRSLDEGRISYEQLVYQMSVAKNVRADIDPEWNALEHFSARDTAILHFTSMSTQPWVSRENPLGYLWVGDLMEAINAGTIAMEFLKQEIAKGHVRPSLLYQVENRVQDSLLLRGKARQMDTKFVPPYQSLPNYQSSFWRYSGRQLRAWLRYCYKNNRAYRYHRMFHDWLYR